MALIAYKCKNLNDELKTKLKTKLKTIFEIARNKINFLTNMIPYIGQCLFKELFQIIENGISPWSSIINTTLTETKSLAEDNINRTSKKFDDFNYYEYIIHNKDSHPFNTHIFNKLSNDSIPKISLPSLNP